LSQASENLVRAALAAWRWVDIEDVRAIGDRLLVALDRRRGNSPHAPLLAPIYLLIEADDVQISSFRVFLDERNVIEAARRSILTEGGSPR
jgi:hypothetical protein